VEMLPISQPNPNMSAPDSSDSGDIDDQILANNQPFNVQIGDFLDQLQLEPSTIIAVLTDGSSLPSWLSFDPLTGQFQGTPPAGFQDTLNLQLQTADGTKDLSTPFELIFAYKLEGSEQNDDVQGTDGNDFCQGGGGDDVLQGALGDDNLFGGDGDDDLMGGSGDDQLEGGSGDDDLMGGDGDDALTGDDGDDDLNGGSGDDQIDGGNGNDQLLGDAGNDQLVGGTGNDKLLGGTGNDKLLGGDGNDNLLGGNGKDVLIGSSGRDRLTGGGGRDVFVLAVGSGFVTILDFHKKGDSLGLSNGIKATNLTIQYLNGNTLITLQSSGDLLASIKGNITLTANSFTTSF